MLNQKVGCSRFDLGRLTLAGWILSLTSLGVFFVTVFGLLSIADGGKQDFLDEEIMIMSGICFGVAAAGFIIGKLLLEYLGFTVIKAKNNTRDNLETTEKDVKVNNIQLNSNQLRLKIKPITDWFFASAQFIIGSVFIYIFTVPGSSKTVSLLLGISFLSLSIWTYLKSFSASINLNKRKNQFLLSRHNLCWQENKEFKISDLTEIKLRKYSFQGNFYEVMAQFNNQQWISLLPISTNQAEYRKIILVIVNFIGQ